MDGRKRRRRGMHVRPRGVLHAHAGILEESQPLLVRPSKHLLAVPMPEQLFYQSHGRKPPVRGNGPSLHLAGDPVPSSPRGRLHHRRQAVDSRRSQSVQRSVHGSVGELGHMEDPEDSGQSEPVPASVCGTQENASPEFEGHLGGLQRGTHRSGSVRTLVTTVGGGRRSATASHLTFEKNKTASTNPITLFPSPNAVLERRWERGKKKRAGFLFLSIITVSSWHTFADRPHCFCHSG